MESVLRGVVLYIAVLLVMRIAGRRTIGQAQPFEFVFILLIAETTQQAMASDDYSITNSIILLATLVSIDLLLSTAKRKLPALDRWLEGRPTVLIAEGVPDREALRHSGVELEDILAAARKSRGRCSLTEIDHAILEVDGSISVIEYERDVDNTS